MFANHFAAAIEAAHPAQLDHCARDLWRAHAAELVADTDAPASGRGDRGAARRSAHCPPDRRAPIGSGQTVEPIDLLATPRAAGTASS